MSEDAPREDTRSVAASLTGPSIVESYSENSWYGWGVNLLTNVKQKVRINLALLALSPLVSRSLATSSDSRLITIVRGGGKFVQERAGRIWQHARA